MFFDGWFDLARIVVVGVLAYAALIAILRVTGKRTLAKMNAFDFAVTVALGSTLASALLSSDVSLSEAVLAFAVLAGLQFAIAFASVRSARVRALVKSEPALLAWEGAMLPEALRRERVTPDELLAAVRSGGQPSLAGVQAVILETDGSFSVVAGTADDSPGDALRPVRGVGRA